MVTVISYDLFQQGDLSSIMEMSTTEYIHVSSKIRKLSIINLGMSEVELNTIKSVPASFNLFNKRFTSKVLNSLDNDCCILTSGTLNESEFETVLNNIKPLIGQTKLIGIGVGKEILMAATESKGWEPSNTHHVHADLNLFAFDENIAELPTLL